MEIVDELMTPGCPNCAVKHLSTALSLCAENSIYNERPHEAHDTLISRARINFVEAVEGYESHWDFGVGLLTRAEEESIQLLGSTGHAKVLRDVRCRAMTATNLEDKVAVIRELRVLSGGAGDVSGHVTEAIRELPAMALKYHELMKVFDIVTTIVELLKWVREEFFNDFETKDNEEKGGKDMATKKVAPKAAAKKAPAKKAVAKKAPVKKGKK